MEHLTFSNNKQVIASKNRVLSRNVDLEFEYRLSMEKQDQHPSAPITQFIQSHVGNVALERESAAELVYGIRRGESKQIERLITALDQQKQAIGINSYGLSMTTIEDVFLR